MKSLHNKQEIFSSFLNDERNIFSKETLLFLEKEGFKEAKNNSYNDDIKGDMVLKTSAGYYSSNWPIFVYIGKNGIAVDIDYDCGGNSSNLFFKFSERTHDIETIFEESYDLMVDYVNKQNSL